MFRETWQSPSNYKHLLHCSAIVMHNGKPSRGLTYDTQLRFFKLTASFVRSRQDISFSCGFRSYIAGVYLYANATWMFDVKFFILNRKVRESPITHTVNICSYSKVSHLIGWLSFSFSCDSRRQSILPPERRFSINSKNSDLNVI
jgi:hypothetical protein